MQYHHSMETAKKNEIDPYNYLLYVLSIRPYYGKSLSPINRKSRYRWSDKVQNRYSNVAKIAAE